MKPTSVDRNDVSKMTYSDLLGLGATAGAPGTAVGVGDPSGQLSTSDPSAASTANSNLHLAADQRSDDVSSSGYNQWLDNDQLGNPSDYSTANYLNQLQGKQGYFDANKVASLNNAIGVIRSSGYPNGAKIANDLTNMVNNGYIYVDPTMEAGTHGTTNMDITKSRGFNINLNPGLFEQNYLANRSKHNANTNWQNDAELSITLMHEYQHATQQSNLYRATNPNAKEDQAYAAAQRYIATLRKNNSMYAYPAWFDGMNDK